jgi:Xaa-Pro dipeptidase
MQHYSRREFIGTVGLSGVALGSCLAAESGAQPPDAGLRSLTTQAKPIAADERLARLARLQTLMQSQQIAALLLEAGSSLEYFTGVRWWRSERTTAALIPARGRAVIVTPYFEEPSIRESLQIEGDVRTWKEDESPFKLLAAAMRERDSVVGPLVIEPTTRFFVWNGVAEELRGARQLRPGAALVGACRMHKSASELALMQVANNVTIAAIRYVHSQVQQGMSGTEILTNLIDATNRLGGNHESSLVLLNEASAFPHGSAKPQAVRSGSVILIDSTCTVHGYLSDISRTWVHDAASKRQHEVWNTVKRGQEIALETATVGTPVGAIDRAVRAYYEGLGWQKDYLLPGLSHRTGHGIGMDVHEPPYLVRSDQTPLAVGMCFSDEPGLYIPGEFGVRLEDCWYMTPQGPQRFTPAAKSLEQPV